MAKKILLVSPVFVCAAVITALVLSGVGGARAEAAAAELEQAKAEIRALLKSGEYEQAQSSIESLRVQFSDDPGLAETLYDIAREYRWVKKYDVAKNMYQQIIEQYPQSASSDRARLGLARIDILSLISSQKDAEAATAVGKLVKDFSGHGDLPETLYWIAKEFEWKMLLPQSKASYQHIIDSCPNSSYVSKAQVGIARVSAGTLVEAGDLAGANAALDRLMVDFAGHEDLPWTLYWLTKRYEGPNEFEKAKSIYWEIMERWPGSEEAEKSRLDIRAVDIFKLLAEGRHSEALAAVDQIIAEVGATEYLTLVMYRTAQEYGYEQGFALRRKGQDSAAEESFRSAVAIWDKTLELGPTGRGMLADIYYLSGICSREVGDYFKAIESFKRMVSEVPEYDRSGNARFYIGRYYQKLKGQGAVSKTVADAETKAAYESLVEICPDCGSARMARLWLKSHKHRR